MEFRRAFVEPDNKKCGDQIVETLPAVKQAPALAGLSYSPGLRPSWRDSNPRPGEFQSVVPTAFAAKKGATRVRRTRLTAFALSRCGAMESCRHSHKTQSFKRGELAQTARRRIENAATKSVKHRLLMQAPALTRLSYSRFDAAGGI